MKYLFLIVILFGMAGCCHSPGFEDSYLCYILRGEPENYPYHGNPPTTIRIRDMDTGETKTYQIRVD